MGGQSPDVDEEELSAMNTEEKMILQGFKISIETLGMAIQELKASAVLSAGHNDSELPEWITLEKAASLKGGPALATYKTKLFLQPCCGRNSKSVGGRKCWHRDEIARWLGIDDSALVAYAGEWKVKLPDNYQGRSA